MDCFVLVNLLYVIGGLIPLLILLLQIGLLVALAYLTLFTFLVSVPQPSYQHIIGPKSPDLADESSFKSSLLDPNSTSRKDMYHSLEPLHTPQDPFFVFNGDGLLRELPSQIMH